MRPLDLARATDDQLLAAEFAHLPIKLKGGKVEARAQRIFAKLAERGIAARPAIWLGEEWYNPDHTVGFAIPFYLAHPRLTRLERKMMFEAEGAREADCLAILRHETGHAIDEAYQLFRTPAYRAAFGSPHRPYPSSYAARPDSHEYVTHLNAWYAQAHPLEDFAETFAVWLASKTRWRRRYKGWPALVKLEQVDRWMTEVADRPPVLPVKPPLDELSQNRRTLGQHYREKRAFYGVGASQSFDRDLKRIFPPSLSGQKGPRAARVLWAIRQPLRAQIARPLGVPAYTVDQILLQMIARARALDLRADKPPEETIEALSGLVTQVTIDAIQNGQRLAL